MILSTLDSWLTHGCHAPTPDCQMRIKFSLLGSHEKFHCHPHNKRVGKAVSWSHQGLTKFLCKESALPNPHPKGIDMFNPKYCKCVSYLPQSSRRSTEPLQDMQACSSSLPASPRRPHFLLQDLLNCPCSYLWLICYYS